VIVRQNIALLVNYGTGTCALPLARIKIFWL
jgi:hypothetical protein